MTPQERDVLLPLLDRLRQTRVPVKDAEADGLIRQAVQAQPDAPYILAQTVLMQDYALHAAESRLRALEQLLEQAQQGQHGGFLGGLFGGGRQAPPPAPLPPGGAGYPQNYAPPPPPYAAPSYGAPSYGTQIAGAVQPGFGGGSSFLRSAAQTAAGVAGGMLLAQGIEDLFGGHHGGGERGFAGDALGGLGGLGGLGAGAAEGFPGGPGSVDQFVDQGGGQGAVYDQGPAAGDQAGFLDSGGDAGYADAGDTGDAGYADSGGDYSGDSFDGGDGGFADDGLSG